MTFCEAVEQPRLRYPNLSHPTWTDEQTKTLIQLHEEGLSATLMMLKINETYGTAFTRNAVIGKADRLNLPKRASKVRSPWQPPSPPSLQSILHRAVTRYVPPPFQFLGLKLVELEPNQCRFPFGGDNGEPILFCGQPQLEGSSYCPHCHSIAHGRSA